MSSEKVLYVQPVGCEGPGWIDLVRPERLEPTLLRPIIGHPIPTRVGEFRAVVVLGGPMGVYEAEQHPWISDTLALLQDCLDREVPVLGICLGSQILAAAAGAEVKATGLQEIGWGRIRLSEAAKEDRLLFGFPSELEVFHWHGDRWDLPEGATLLAGSEPCDHQVFRLGRKAYGFQCHLEVTRETPLLWAEAYLDDLLNLPNGPKPETIARETARFSAQLEPHAKEVFRRFWELV